MQYSSLHPVGRYGLKVVAERLFSGRKDGQAPCLFISGGCAIPVQAYLGNDFEPTERQFHPPDNNHEPVIALPVYQTLLRLLRDDVLSNRQAMLGLGRRTQVDRRVNHHPPLGSTPAKKAELLRHAINQATIDEILADAELI